MKNATILKISFDSLSEAKNLMPDAALTDAILEYKNNLKSDPKYWAAFSIFGVPY